MKNIKKITSEVLGKLKETKRPGESHWIAIAIVTAVCVIIGGLAIGYNWTTPFNTITTAINNLITTVVGWW